ncbi:unnamed protein product [Phytomonas sp. Hart1]|nr:unnamed protein product [Phytomonas sp. Hart1]|eukprot:CCW66148.1 unnamed protein product [Phytomonas sp. isolate Hart1]
MYSGILHVGRKSPLQPSGINFLTDSYTTTHEPLQSLLREWQVLNRKIHEKVSMLQSKKPRSPCANELLRGGRPNTASNPSPEGVWKDPYFNPGMGNAPQGIEASSNASSAFFERSLDSASSTYTAHERHTRYSNIGTAYRQVSEPYGRYHEIERQRKFINEYKRLARPFVPSSASMDILNKPTRLLLGDCVRDVYQSIASDWKEAHPIVMSTAEDLIVVYVSLKALTRRKSLLLLRYMNDALKRCAVISRYGLTKVVEGWNVLTDDGYLMYTLRPEWVKGQRFLPPPVVTPEPDKFN